MPQVKEPTPITRVLGVPRKGLHQHVFVGGNFFLQKMLNRYRGELDVSALPQELTAAAEGTAVFLESRSARVRIGSMEIHSGRLQAEVEVDNLAGHKLPTAFPSRRAWLHVLVRDRNRRTVFESGALRPDGSIVGNANDADPTRFEPYYSEITRPDQVEIYEDIMKTPAGGVTTGLLTAVGYLKDDRLLPDGFDKQTAEKNIAVIGRAAKDPNFTGGSDPVLYSVALGDAQGPFQVVAELWYQPIGYRWANNLKPYDRAAEPRRFNAYYDAMGPATAVMLAKSEATETADRGGFSTRGVRRATAVLLLPIVPDGKAPRAQSQWAFQPPEALLRANGCSALLSGRAAAEALLPGRRPAIRPPFQARVRFRPDLQRQTSVRCGL